MELLQSSYNCDSQETSEDEGNDADPSPMVVENDLACKTNPLNVVKCREEVEKTVLQIGVKSMNCEEDGRESSVVSMNSEEDGRESSLSSVNREEDTQKSCLSSMNCEDNAQKSSFASMNSDVQQNSLKSPNCEAEIQKSSVTSMNYENNTQAMLESPTTSTNRDVQFKPNSDVTNVPNELCVKLYSDELVIAKLLHDLITNVERLNNDVTVNWTLDYGYRAKDSSSGCSGSDSESTNADADEETTTSVDSDDVESIAESIKEKIENPKPYATVKTKGEIGLSDLPAIEDLHISVPEAETHLIGKITSIVHSIVVIQSMEKEPALDIDSVLFLKGGTPLGKVFDVFGRVTCPFYSVRFNSSEDIIQKDDIKLGAEVFSAPGHAELTNFVFTEQLMKQKGSDASWKDNNEPPDECVEFSDDEAEKAHRQALRNKKKLNTQQANGKTQTNNQQTNRSASRQNFIHSSRFGQHQNKTNQNEVTILRHYNQQQPMALNQFSRPQGPQPNFFPSSPQPQQLYMPQRQPFANNENPFHPSLHNNAPLNQFGGPLSLTGLNRPLASFGSPGILPRSNFPGQFAQNSPFHVLNNPFSVGNNFRPINQNQNGHQSWPPFRTPPPQHLNYPHQTQFTNNPHQTPPTNHPFQPPSSSIFLPQNFFIPPPPPPRSQ